MSNIISFLVYPPDLFLRPTEKRYNCPYIGSITKSQSSFPISTFQTLLFSSTVYYSYRRFIMKYACDAAIGGCGLEHDRAFEVQQCIVRQGGYIVCQAFSSLECTRLTTFASQCIADCCKGHKGRKYQSRDALLKHQKSSRLVLCPDCDNQV